MMKGRLKGFMQTVLAGFRSCKDEKLNATPVFMVVFASHVKTKEHCSVHKDTKS
eukprot:m.252813 g.252813  ORF g.252813 m.252813 type:complete len:54 (+) comp173422_c0_seq1:61-222(+)